MTILNNNGMTMWKIKKRKDKAVLGIPISEEEFLQEYQIDSNPFFQCIGE